MLLFLKSPFILSLNLCQKVCVCKSLIIHVNTFFKNKSSVFYVYTFLLHSVFYFEILMQTFEKKKI